VPTRFCAYFLWDRFLCGHYKVSVQTVKRLVNLHNIHVAHGDTFAKIVTSMPFLVTAWEASGTSLLLGVRKCMRVCDCCWVLTESAAFASIV